MQLFKMTSPKPSFTFYRVNGWPGPDDSDLLKFEFPTTKAANQSSIERRIQTVESSTLRQPKITSIQLTTPKSTVHLSTIHHSTVLHSTVLLSTGHLSTGQLSTGQLSTGQLSTGQLSTGHLSTGHLSTGHPSIGHHSTVHHSTVHQPILRQSTLHQSTETTSSHSPVRQMKCVLFEDRLPQQTLELFSCNQMSLFGYYADVSSNCQVN